MATNISTRDREPAESGLPVPVRPTLRSSRVLQAAVGMVLVQLAFRAWATFSSWYTFDDFLFISRMSNDGLHRSIEPYAGHVMPGGMLLSWLADDVAPYDFRLTAAMLLLMQLLADVGLVVLLVRLFGARAGILPPLAVYLFCVISVPVAIWWAAGVNQLPLQVALFWGLASHVQHLRTRRLGPLLQAVGWLLVGLAFYEKTVLVLGAIGIVSLNYFATGGLGSRLAEMWRGYRAATLTYVGLGLAYLAGYVEPGPQLRDRRRDQLGRRRRRLLPRAPGLCPRRARRATALDRVRPVLPRRPRQRRPAGQPRTHRARRPRAGTKPEPQPARLVAGAVLPGLRRGPGRGRPRVVRRRPHLSRLPLPGRDGGGHRRRAGLRRDADRRCPRGSDAHRHQRPPGPSASGRAACTVVAALGTVSSVQYVSHWRTTMPGKPYFTTLLGSIRSADAPVPLVDEAVPDTIMWPLGYPENLLSHLLVHYPDDVRFVDVSTDHLNVVDDTGRVVPAQISTVRRALPGPRAGCGYAVEQKARTLPLDGPVAFGGWWVRIGYLSSARSPVVVTAGSNSYSTVIEPGVHALYFHAGDEFDSVSISGLADGVRLCTDDVTVGHPSAR